MTIDAGDVLKFLLGGGGFGAAFAAVKPFAERLFNHWLSGREKSADAARQREDRTLVALEKVGAREERIVSVLERIYEQGARVDARLDRIEGHLGITVNPSAVPPEPPKVDPRRSITGEYPAVRDALPSAP